MPINEPKREMSNRKGQTQEDNIVDNHKGYTRVLPTGNMDPREIFQNDPRTPPTSPWHGEKFLQQGSGDQRYCHNNIP